MTTHKIHVLIADDNEHDAKLMMLALKQGGIEASWERIDTAPALRHALESNHWDVVLADHAMPRLDSVGVLRIAGGLREPPPTIVVSGHIGEESLAHAFRAGAFDYVSKNHLSSGLAPAVKRALHVRKALRGTGDGGSPHGEHDRLAAVAGLAHELGEPLGRVAARAEKIRERLAHLRASAAKHAAGQPDIEASIEELLAIVRSCEEMRLQLQDLQHIARGDGRHVRA